MLIGPHNLTLHVNHVRSRIRNAAVASGRDPGAVTLVAVTKSQTAETVRLAATAGVTDFGENYLKEALAKMDLLADLRLLWHFIGAIQSNKTRSIAERFDWVHSIDRLERRPAAVGAAPFSRPAAQCLHSSGSGAGAEQGQASNRPRWRPWPRVGRTSPDALTGPDVRAAAATGRRGATRDFRAPQKAAQRI